MTKTQINTMITHLKKAKMTGKVSPWLLEGSGEQILNVRYVGLILTQEWAEVFSPKNNIMLKFSFSKQGGRLEIFFANRPPFTLLQNTKLTADLKLEPILGKLRHQLKIDKADYTHHRDSVGNLYKKIVASIK